MFEIVESVEMPKVFKCQSGLLELERSPTQEAGSESPSHRHQFRMSFSASCFSVLVRPNDSMPRSVMAGAERGSRLGTARDGQFLEERQLGELCEAIVAEMLVSLEMEYS